MKKILFLLVILIAIGMNISAQNIVRLDYSIDEFVAEGKGTTINTTAADTELDVRFNIDISGLTPGIHTIYFRSLNEDGIWSLPVEKTFYIPEPEMVEGIVEIEYSMNGFVKEEAGNKITVQKKTSHLDSTINIDIANLEQGLHSFYMRAKNKYGIWSVPVEKAFVVSRSDTTKIDKIYYRIYNEEYESVWMNSIVAPSRKLVDSSLFVPVTELDFNKNYSIEFYAKNTTNIRGFSAYLNNLILNTNNAPTSLKDTINLSMFRNEVLSISMDSLFNDIDLVNGDSLMYSLTNPDNQDIFNFSSWDLPTVLSLSPGNNNVGSYKFWFIATDLAGERDSVEVMLIVNNVTGTNSFEEADAKFNIYPNPTNDFLTVQILDNSILNYYLRLYNYQGQILFDKFITKTPHTINLSGYSQGAYFLTMQTNSEVIKKQLIHN